MPLVRLLGIISVLGVLGVGEYVHVFHSENAGLPIWGVHQTGVKSDNTQKLRNVKVTPKSHGAGTFASAKKTRSSISSS